MSLEKKKIRKVFEVALCSISLDAFVTEERLGFMFSKCFLTINKTGSFIFKEKKAKKAKKPSVFL